MKVLTYAALTLALLAVPVLSQAEWNPRRAYSNGSCRYAAQRPAFYNYYRRPVAPIRKVVDRAPYYKGTFFWGPRPWRLSDRELREIRERQHRAWNYRRNW